MLQAAIPAGILGLLTGVGLAQPGGPPSMLKRSPLRGVRVVTWVVFTRRFARHPLGYRSPRGQLGTFGLDPRRLADVGLVEGATKSDVGGVGRWTAKWRSPVTEEAFLGSLPLQYEAFKATMVGLVPRVSKYVGAEVDGAKCTLSGLLGVGHAAGAASVESWVKDPAERAKFGKTTETFRATNGIF